MRLPILLRSLGEALRGPLPGHSALRELSGYPRPPAARARKYDPVPRESAVLVLIYPKEGELHTLLMLRPVYEGVHSGQIGFPGGKQEDGDPTLEFTALREFAEETGSHTKEIAILGSLTPIYIPLSRAIVTPFIAYTEELGSFDPDPNEVAELIETPLTVLLDDRILKKRRQHITILDTEMEIPYYDIFGHVVWGATAMMIAELRELFNRLRDAELRQQNP